MLEKLKSTNIRHLRVDYSTVSDGTKGLIPAMILTLMVEYSTISDGTKGIRYMSEHIQQTKQDSPLL